MKALIFDFDGTIVDTEGLWYEIYDIYFQKEWNYKIPLEVFARGIGSENYTVFYELEKEMGVKLNYQEIERDLHALYNDRVDSLVVREGVIDLMNAATKKNITLAIATSSSRDYLLSYLKKFNLTDYFSVLKTKDDVRKVKPDPEIYLQTIEELAVDPKDALVIEDSINGSKAALAAGIPCVVVPNKVTAASKFPEQVEVLDHFTEIKDRI